MTAISPSFLYWNGRHCRSGAIPDGRWLSAKSWVCFPKHIMYNIEYIITVNVFLFLWRGNFPSDLSKVNKSFQLGLNLIRSWQQWSRTRQCYYFRWPIPGNEQCLWMQTWSLTAFIWSWRKHFRSLECKWRATFHPYVFTDALALRCT